VTDPSGAAVAAGHYDTTVTYSAGGHEGRGIYTFDADVPGTYAGTHRAPRGPASRWFAASAPAW
jgi:hypothetical protein